MNQTIRNNTFETNSSSMHSLVVVKHPKPYADDYTLGYPGQKEFDLFWYDSGEYGRSPFQVLRTPLDKLRYYVAHYIGFMGEKKLVKKVIDFIHEQTGVPKKKINIKAYDNYECKYDGYGYAGINDTGEDVFTYIEDNNISMEEFVLNPKYVVIVDGDEYQEFKKLFRSNILNAKDFEYISSGPDFWNDNIFELNLHWLISPDSDFDLKRCINDINEFRDEIQLEVDEDTCNEYNNYIDQITVFIEAARKKNANLTTSITYPKAIKDFMKNKDKSMFNYVKIKKEWYGPVIEKIKNF